MAAQENQNNKNIAEVLLFGGLISQEVYDKVKLENINTGKPFDEILTSRNLALPREIAKAKGEIYGIPYIDIAQASVSPEALNVLPEAVARRYACFPYVLDHAKGTLSVIMANPTDLVAIEFIEKKTGKRLVPYIADAESIKTAIDKRYTQSLSSEVTAALKETTVAGLRKTRVFDAQQMGKVIREAPIAKIVSTLLEFAIRAKASDVHIEPQENKTRVRYRIDGILHEKLVLPKSVHDSVVSRIKILSAMKIDEKRVPQDGRFSFRHKEEEVDLRVSSLPSTYGEKIVMRLLKRSGKVPELQELGLRGRALKNLGQAVLVPHGVILITGPTGSGKTTTLYSILSKINTVRVNIITVEDPIEYEIVGINQVQVNPQAGLTFASGLRSFLRQDPDIIMVGEIRDQETASLAVQASLTGHLVFSTLHTNSAAGALPRLLDMKIEPYLLASSMTCVVAQRVARKICTNCKEEYEPSTSVSEEIRKFLGPLLAEGAKIKLFRGKRCPECSETGYSGRIGIFEVLPVTEKISRLILERAPSGKIEKQAIEEGMIIMKQDGYLKALEGITTIEEVLRIAQI